MNGRRDDWHSSIDANLAALNAGQRVWERDLKDLRRFNADTDRLLRGNTADNTAGLIARVHELEDEIRMLKAILLDDPITGHVGLVGQVSALQGSEKKKDRALTIRVSVIGLISAIAVAILTNLETVERFFGKGQKPDQLHQMINKAKTRRGRPIVKYRVIPRPPDQPQADPQEPPADALP